MVERAEEKLMLDLPHFLLHLAHVHGGGGGQFSGPDAAVEVLEADLPAVQVVMVGFSAHLQTQGQDHNAQLLRHFGSEVAAAVCEDHIIAHQSLCSFLALAAFLASAFLSASGVWARSWATYWRLTRPAA